MAVQTAAAVAAAAMAVAAAAREAVLAGVTVVSRVVTKVVVWAGVARGVAATEGMPVVVVDRGAGSRAKRTADAGGGGTQKAPRRSNCVG